MLPQNSSPTAINLCKNHTQKIHLKKKQKISATCKFFNFKYIYETTYISFAYRLFDSESFI